MKPITKYRQLIALWALLLLGLTGCDTTLDVNEKITGYKTISAKISWQADPDTKYKITVDGKDTTFLFIPRSQEAVHLQVFNVDSNRMEIDEQVLVKDGSQSISLIQLPEQPIQMISESNESDPKDKHHVKVRLFYNQDVLNRADKNWGKRVKVELFASVDREKTFKPTGIVFELESGKLSDYVELDLNLLWPEGGDRAIIFNSDVTDLETGELLQDHSKKGNGQIGYNQDGNNPTLTKEGWMAKAKLMTLNANPSTRFVRFLPISALTVPWETEEPAQ